MVSYNEEALPHSHSIEYDFVNPELNSMHDDSLSALPQQKASFNALASSMEFDSNPTNEGILVSHIDETPTLHQHLELNSSIALPTNDENASDQVHENSSSHHDSQESPAQANKAHHCTYVMSLFNIFLNLEVFKFNKSYFFRFEQCNYSTDSHENFDSHMIREHGIGTVFLCECGYMALTLRLIQSHQTNSKKLKYGMLRHIELKKRENAELKGYEFSHRHFIAVKTQHAEKYSQIRRHDLHFIKKYVDENVNRLFNNQKKFKQLWGQGVRKVENDDEFQ